MHETNMTTERDMASNKGKQLECQTIFQMQMSHKKTSYISYFPLNPGV